MSDSINLLTRRVLSLLVVLLCLATAGRADDFHYVNILVGDRAADLGGAYAAVSDNASGCFYNPAGIVYGVGSNLSASVNAFSNATKSYQGALTNTAGQKLDWEQTSSVLLPNFFGATYDLSFGTLGLSYAVPDSVQRNQQQIFTSIRSTVPGTDISEYHIKMNDVDNSYLFGPSLAFKFSDSFSLGATLYGMYRDSTFVQNHFLKLRQTATNTILGSEWRNFYEYRTEYGIKPILGLMASPLDKLSFGLTVAKPWILSSNYESHALLSTDLYASPDNNNPRVVENDGKRSIPAELRASVAFFPTPALLFTADLSYRGKGGEYINFSAYETEQVVNAAVGAEVYLSESYALRAGFYTDFANTPEIVNDGVTKNQPEHIDLFGGTLSLSRFTRSTSTTLGVGYSSGSGDAQVNGGNAAVQKVEMQNLLVYLSAAYNF